MDFIADSELISFNREDLDKIIGRLENKIIERVLCSIPDMIIHLARRTDAINKLYADLFKVCPECSDDKELLARVINKLEVANAGLSPEDLFKLVPDSYREAKGLISNLGSVDMSKLNETVNGII